MNGYLEVCSDPGCSLGHAAAAFCCIPPRHSSKSSLPGELRAQLHLRIPPSAHRLSSHLTEVRAACWAVLTVCSPSQGCSGFSCSLTLCLEEEASRLLSEANAFPLSEELATALVSSPHCLLFFLEVISLLLYGSYSLCNGGRSDP